MSFIGKKISQLRKNNNMSQQELAEKLNVSNKTISKWECGNGNPDIDYLKLLSEIFNVSLDELVSDKKLDEKNGNIEADENIKNTQNLESKKLRNKKVLLSSIISIIGVMVIAISLLCFFLIPRKPQIKSSSVFVINNEESTMSLVVENNKDTFSFNNVIKVPRNNDWQVYYDSELSSVVESSKVNLQVGNNVFYIEVKNSVGDKKIYKVNIKRNNMYSVLFNTNGGDELDEILIEEGSFLPDIVPVRKGYQFDGWDYDISNAITTDLLLTASWTAKNFSIEYHSNNDKNMVLRQNVTYDDLVILETAEEFTKEGDFISGWNTEADGTGESFDVGEIFSSYNIDKNLKLYAQWLKLVTVTLNVGEGTNISQNSVVLEHGKNFTLPVTTKYESSFVGWFDDSGKQYTNENGISIINWDKLQDTTLTARFKTNEYLVKVESNIQAGGIVTGAGMTEFGANVILKATANSGYTCIGWFDSNGTRISTDDQILFVMSNKQVTYIVKWQANTYTVTLNVNGGNEIIGNVKNITFNSSYNLPVTTRDYYKFAGWYAGENGTETQLTNSKGASVSEWKITKNTEIYAKWTPIEYKITYILNGGENHEDNPSTYNIEDLVELKYPTKEGYTFNGWVVANSNVAHKDLKIEIGNYGVRSFAASWVINLEEFIEISSVEQLKSISSDTSGYYCLTSNILFNGNEWTSIESFSGVFDGNGYSIIGMTLNGNSFIEKNLGIIKNIKFVNTTISATSKTLASVVVADNEGTIDAVEVKDVVANIQNVQGFGLIAGQNSYKAIISDCKTSGAITGTATYCGGIVGYNYSRVSSCYSLVSINLTNGTAGGICGYQQYATYHEDFWNDIQKAIVSSSYFIGEITAKYVYGIANSYEESEVIYCFVNALLNGDNVYAITNQIMSADPNSYYVSTMPVQDVFVGNCKSVDLESIYNKDWVITKLHYKEYINEVQNWINKGSWVFSDNTYPKLYWEV